MKRHPRGNAPYMAPNFEPQVSYPPIDNMYRNVLTLPQMQDFSRTINELSSDVTLLMGSFTSSHALQTTFLSLRDRISDFEARIALLRTWIETRERREARGREATQRQLEGEWSKWDGIARDWEDFVVEIEEMKGRLEGAQEGDAYAGVETRFKVLGNRRLTWEMREKKKENEKVLRSWEAGPDGELERGGVKEGMMSGYGSGSTFKEGATSFEMNAASFAPFSRGETPSLTPSPEKKINPARHVSIIASRSPSVAGEKAPNNKKPGSKLPPVFGTFRHNKNSTNDKSGSNSPDQRKRFKQDTPEPSFKPEEPALKKPVTSATSSYNPYANTINAGPDNTERIHDRETSFPEKMSFHADERDGTVFKIDRKSNPNPLTSTKHLSKNLSLESSQPLGTKVRQDVSSHSEEHATAEFKIGRKLEPNPFRSTEYTTNNPSFGSRPRDTSVSQEIPFFVASPEERASKKLKTSTADHYRFSGPPIYSHSPQTFYSKAPDAKSVEREYIVISDDSAERSFEEPSALANNPNTSLSVSSNRTSTKMHSPNDVLLDKAAEGSFKIPQTSAATSHDSAGSAHPGQAYNKGLHDGSVAREDSVASNGAVEHIVKRARASAGSSFNPLANSMNTLPIPKSRENKTLAAQEMASIFEQRTSKKLKATTAHASNTTTNSSNSLPVHEERHETPAPQKDIPIVEQRPPKKLKTLHTSITDQMRGSMTTESMNTILFGDQFSTPATPWVPDELDIAELKTLAASPAGNTSSTNLILPESNKRKDDSPAAQDKPSMPNKLDVKDPKTYPSSHPTSSDVNTVSASWTNNLPISHEHNQTYQTPYAPSKLPVPTPSREPDQHLSSSSSTSRIPISPAKQDLNPNPPSRLRPRTTKPVEETDYPRSESDSDIYRPSPLRRRLRKASSASTATKARTTSTTTIPDSDAESANDVKQTRRLKPRQTSAGVSLSDGEKTGFKIGTTTRAEYKQQVEQEARVKQKQEQEQKQQQQEQKVSEQGNEAKDEESPIPMTRRRRTRKNLEVEEKEKETRDESEDAEGEGNEKGKNGNGNGKGKGKGKAKATAKAKAKGKSKARAESEAKANAALQPLPILLPEHPWPSTYSPSTIAQLNEVTASTKLQSQHSTKQRSSTTSSSATSSTTSSSSSASASASSEIAALRTLESENSRLGDENRALKRALKISEMTSRSLEGEITEMGLRLQRKIREFAELGLSDSEEGVGA
ncbi:hypothetical protein VTL71DRAFT_9719 [Oculimacula yallundae]|uniref:Uncharacterized protein n=1 Tax=Oculimacula yallundae TaxID=86028 RepID=A0ABR4BRN5_9HELO